MLPCDLEALKTAVRGYPDGRVDDVGPGGECIACRDGPVASSKAKAYMFARDPGGRGFKNVQKHFKRKAHLLCSEIMACRRYKGGDSGRGARPGGMPTPALDELNDAVGPGKVLRLTAALTLPVL